MNSTLSDFIIGFFSGAFVFYVVREILARRRQHYHVYFIHYQKWNQSDLVGYGRKLMTTTGVPWTEEFESLEKRIASEYYDSNVRILITAVYYLGDRSHE